MIALIVLILVIAVAVAIAGNRAYSPPFPASDGDGGASLGVDSGRLILYGVSFIGLMGFLFAAMGLVSVGLAQTVFASHNLMSSNDARTQLSYYLAALLVATPLWLVFWTLVQRRIDRWPVERQAPERRLYFALVFAIAGVVSLYALHTIVRVLITLPAPHNGDASLRDGVSALIRLLVYGGAWLYYTRLAYRERSSRERDPARDLALSVVSGFSLTFLAIGGVSFIATVLQHLVPGTGSVFLIGSSGSPWKEYGEPVAWLIAGAAVWTAASIHDARYPGVRAFRVPYLYVVLLVSAAGTVGFGVDALYELVRLAFGYRPDAPWGFLAGTMSFVLTLGAIWAFHWQVLRRQAMLWESQPDDGGIPWPRRPYLTVLSFAGLALASAGAVTIIWVGLDALFSAHSAFLGSAWWRDQLSVGVALLLGGAAAWLRPWAMLQAAAQRSPRERRTQARRWLLGAVILGSALIGVGFLIAFLWLILQMVLGASNATEADKVASAFKYVATALVAAGIAAYHAIVLRSDLRAGTGRGARIRVSVLVTPAATDTLAGLARRIGHDVTVAGYLTSDTADAGVPLDALDGRLDELARAGASQALLILSPDSAVIYPYSRNRPAPRPGPAEPDLHVAPTTP